MLKVLKGHEETIKGLIVCEESGSASSLPLVLHLLSTETSSSKKVAIVTSRLTEMNYKLICSKAGVRWNSSQIAFFELVDPYGDFNITAEDLMQNVKQKVSDSEATAVLFDDLSVLEQFGASPVDVTVFVHEIYSLLRAKSSEPPVVVAPFSIPSRATALLRRRCNVLAQFTPIGHGFGKDASSKMVFTIPSENLHATKKGILLSGERTINGTWVSVE